MATRIWISMFLTGLFAADALADVTILNETFDSYADQAAFEAVWQPFAGPNNNGALVPGSFPGLTPPNDNPPGIQGKAVNVFQGINTYVGPATAQMETLVPTETQNVRFSVDIFEDGQGNKTLTAGLRNSSTPSNIFELGLLNFGPPDTNEPATDFAIRAVLLSGGGPSPSWHYFALNPALERPDDLDDIVTIGDVGANHWHRWTADIGLTETTFTLDLYRDGLANTEATPDVGSPGVDASVTFPIVLFGAPDPFNNLRIGTPSNIAGNPNEAVIDNVFLGLVDIASSEDNADFDGNGIVDGRDFLTWQRNFGVMGTATLMDGDANGDQNVDALDLGIWQDQYGTPLLASTAAIPEPTSAILIAAALAAFGGVRPKSSSC